MVDQKALWCCPTPTRMGLGRPVSNPYNCETLPGHMIHPYLSQPKHAKAFKGVETTTEECPDQILSLLKKIKKSPQSQIYFPYICFYFASQPCLFFIFYLFIFISFFYLQKKKKLVCCSLPCSGSPPKNKTKKNLTWPATPE